MEVSNEIKEDILRTQTELKNAIQVHQIWVARLQDDESNIHLKNKVSEAEKEIVAIGRDQNLVVERLRKELELYQHRLRAKNKQVSIENDNRYIAQQLRDHQLQYRNRNRTSLLKPSVLNEIQIKTENTIDELNNISDGDNETKSPGNNPVHNENCKESFVKNFPQLQKLARSENSNYENALNKVKEVFLGTKFDDNDWPEISYSDSSPASEPSPAPSPPPLPQPGEPVSKEIFMRLLGLVTPLQKTFIERTMRECRKRSSSANRSDLVYGNFDMISKRKKLNQFPYLQNHNDPPQTRSAKLRKQNQSKSSREGSPSGSSTDNNKAWINKGQWASNLPASLPPEPVFSSTKKVCHGCGRNDVPSLLVWCSGCGVWQHTGCGAGDGSCAKCLQPLPEPDAAPEASAQHKHLFSDKLAERKRLQERNIELCEELRKLEARAASLKENLDEHNAEKRQLLADQIQTQKNLQKLLDFISRFKETSLSSLSESGSEASKPSDE